MPDNRRPSIAVWILLALLALCALDVAWRYDELPDRIAVHFGVDGQADRWDSKAGFAVTCAIAEVFVLVIFLGVPALIRRTPDRWLRLPNKSYWLVPERRASALGKVVSTLHWNGVASAFLLLVCFDALMRVALGLQEGLGAGFLWTFIAYMIFVPGSAVWLVLQLRVPRAEMERTP